MTGIRNELATLARWASESFGVDAVELRIGLEDGQTVALPLPRVESRGRSFGTMPFVMVDVDKAPANGDRHATTMAATPLPLPDLAPRQQAIVNLLRRGRLNGRDVAKRLGKTYVNISNELSKLKKRGILDYVQGRGYGVAAEFAAAMLDNGK